MDDDEMQRLLDRQAELQDRIDAVGAWELDSKLELAMDALRCPPGDTVVDVLSGARSGGWRCAVC
jgi:sulfate-transporting ATPase